MEEHTSDSSQLERPLLHLSHTCSQMSTYPQHGLQQSSSTTMCSHSSQRSVAPSPANSSASSQQWQNIHSPSLLMFCTSNHQQIKAPSQPRLVSCPEKTCVQQQQQDKQKVVAAPASECCTATPAPSRHPESDAITSSCKQSQAATAMTAELPTVANILDSNVFTSKSFMCPEIVDYNSRKDSTTHRDVGESSSSGAIYSSFFFLGQSHDYTAAESQSSTVRPVQSCQENLEDTSSSDDEGKLIIEL